MTCCGPYFANCILTQSDRFSQIWSFTDLLIITSSFLRGYSGKKLSDNIECEIFQTILEEARESFSDSIVHELPSNLPEDLEHNVETISQYVHKWTPQS